VDGNQPNGAKLEKTGTRGIFRRHRKDCSRKGRCDCSYAVPLRVKGRQVMRTFPTFAEAREAKRKGEASPASSDFAETAKVMLKTYALEWVERYQGTGRRGFRQETRDEYRRLLNKYVLKFFPPQTKLTDVDPRSVAEYVAWLVRQPAERGKDTPARGTLSDSSVRNALKPLSACLATARREGLVAHNSADRAALPHRERIEDDEEKARPFPEMKMELVVSLIARKHRLMFELLAATGVRRSELLALEGRHFHLDGLRPFVRVRQRVRRQRGNGLVIGPLKSRHARRDLPIPLDVADRLRALRVAPDALAFLNEVGTLLDPDNIHERVLKPACEEAAVEWAGFHTFRHSVASRLFAEGRSVVAVQRWLGHHAPSFTLDTYVHLLDADLGEPLQVNTGSTERPQTPANDDAAVLIESAFQSGNDHEPQAPAIAA
jgi:integrase